MIQTIACLNLLPFHFFPMLLYALVRLLPDLGNRWHFLLSQNPLNLWGYGRWKEHICVYVFIFANLLPLLQSWWPQRDSILLCFHPVSAHNIPTSPILKEIVSFGIILFYLNTIAWQYCVSFCCTTKWTNYVHTHTSSPPGAFLPSTLIPCP